MGTTTTNYSLYKPAQGETGWDDEINSNFDTIDTQMKSNEDGLGGSFAAARRYVTGQSVSSGSWAQVQIGDAESFNSGIGFTSNQFYALTAGYYLIQGQVHFAVSPTNSNYQKRKYGASIEVDGVIKAYYFDAYYATSPAPIGRRVSTVAHLDVDDIVKLHAYNGANATCGLTAGAAYTYLEMVLLHADA